MQEIQGPQSFLLWRAGVDLVDTEVSHTTIFRKLLDNPLLTSSTIALVGVKTARSLQNAHISGNEFDWAVLRAEATRSGNVWRTRSM